MTWSRRRPHGIAGLPPHAGAEPPRRRHSAWQRAVWHPALPAVMLALHIALLAWLGPRPLRLVGFGVGLIWLVLAVQNRRSGGAFLDWLYPGPRVPRRADPP